MAYYMHVRFDDGAGTSGTESYVATEHPVLIVARQNAGARAGERIHRLELLFFEKIPDEVFAAVEEIGDYGIEVWVS